MTIPLKRYLGWTPTQEGVEIATALGTDELKTELNMIEVRELRDDMEEAQMLSRGCEKLEVEAEHVQQYDKILVGCNVLMVSSVLASAKGETVIQFGDSYTEMTMPGDAQLTVWRAIQ